MPDPWSPILLVRFTPDAVVADDERRCHLVPVPQSGQIPDMLRAFCGVEIATSSAELLDGITATPCPRCVRESGTPMVEILRTVPPEPGYARRRELVGWSDRGLTPQQRLLARFVLLLLLQHPDDDLSLAHIAERLDHEPTTVNLIVLLYTVVGWVHRSWTPDQADQPWTACRCRLTTPGARLARQLLARHLTPVFVDVAGRLGLDTALLASDEPDGGPSPGG